MERKELQDALLKAATAMGFTQAEVYYQGGESFEVLLMEGEVSSYKNSKESGLAFRGIFDGRVGNAFTESLSEEAIPFLLESARENALLLPDGEEETFYGGEAYQPFDGYSPALEETPVEKRILMAKRMEQSALSGSAHVASLDYCKLGMQKKEIAIQNTQGLNASYTKNFASGFVTAIAKAEGETKTGSYFWKGKSWDSFYPEAVGKEAARRAASLLGAKTVASGKYPVLLHSEAMADLLGVFAPIFFGETAQKGFSLLRDKLGETIAAPCVTLRDDALLPQGFASVPFDSEGVAGKNKAILENGVLKTLLYNRKSAAKDGVASTGNGFKNGLTSPVKTACTNFYIQNGEKTESELLEAMGNGLYIIGFMGLHSGANMISGDFSLSAEGYAVAHGKIRYSVEQITVAGNFYSLLKNIVAVGNNLAFFGGREGSPSVLIKELDIGGK